MIIQDLVKQMSVLNQNMTLQTTESSSSYRGQDAVDNFPFPPPPPLPSTPILVVKSNVIVGGCPAPPPPPPPPMPTTLFQGYTPIKITKSKQTEVPKAAPAPSMMDVLKDLNKVKLNRIQRYLVIIHKSIYVIKFYDHFY
jgi:hypothetical protein